jgi:hypothetical protein
MILRSGLKYEYSCNNFDQNTFFKHLKIDIKNINELDILFINDFCYIISKLNNSNQIDKIQIVSKMYSLIYNNRESLINIFNVSSDFIDFILLIYDKSNTFTDFIMKLIPEYNETPYILLDALYYLYKTKAFIETEFNI